VDGRSKVSERNFALGVSVRRVAEQGRFLGQGVLGGVLGMVHHAHGRWYVAQNGSGQLRRGRSGAEKTKERESDDSGLHKLILSGGKLHVVERTAGSGFWQW